MGAGEKLGFKINLVHKVSNFLQACLVFDKIPRVIVADFKLVRGSRFNCCYHIRVLGTDL